MNHNELMNARLEKMNELFARAESFQYEMSQLREAYGLTLDERFARAPKEERAEVVQNIREHHESAKVAMNEAKNVYEDIDIDDIIRSMDLGIEL